VRAPESVSLSRSRLLADCLSRSAALPLCEIDDSSVMGRASEEERRIGELGAAAKTFSAPRVVP
jgi:hypothetical protein